nr:hypothetical protein [Tanacetum cinerariifolium]
MIKYLEMYMLVPYVMSRFVIISVVPRHCSAVVSNLLKLRGMVDSVVVKHLRNACSRVLGTRFECSSANGVSQLGEAHVGQLSGVALKEVQGNASECVSDNSKTYTDSDAFDRYSPLWMGRDTVHLETAINTISQEYLLEFTLEYGIPEALHPELPGPEDRIVDFSEGKVGVDWLLFTPF